MQAGNKTYDLERAEHEAREKVRATKKFKELKMEVGERAQKSANDEHPTNFTDALTQAAQLASLTRNELMEIASSSDGDTTNDSEEEGEVEIQSDEPQLQQAKKRKNKHSDRLRRAKSKRVTTAHDAKSPDKLQMALVKHADRKTPKEVKRAAKVVSEDG